MALVLNEEQRLLAETAREFLQENAPVAALRSLRDSRDTTGYSRDLWRQMAELGWASVILPETYGGLEFGFTGIRGRRVRHSAGRDRSAARGLPAAARGR